MNAYVVGLALAWISLSWGLLVSPSSTAVSFKIRVIILWAFSALILFMVRDWLIVLLLAAVAIVLIAPTERTARAAFFVIAVPSLPTYLSVPLPFPGLNYLTDLTHYKIAAVVILLPLVLTDQNRARVRSTISKSDALLIIYIIYTASIIGGEINSTVALRHAFDLMLVLALPYYVMRNSIRSMESVDAILQAFVLVSLLLAAIVIVSTLRQWDFYAFVQPTNIFNLPDYRAGFVRIQAVANTHSLAYHLAAALVILEYIKVRSGLGWLHLMMLRSMLIAGMYFTNAKGAMLALGVGGLSYLLIQVRSNILRSWMVLCFVLACLGASFWLLFGVADRIDNYGTVGYRQELFRVSISYILQNPWTGDYNFYKNPLFEPLRQGQGIIDITNFYLQVLLHYGFLGAVPLFAALAGPAIALFILTYHVDFYSSGVVLRRVSGVLFGSLLGWLFLVGTTSDVALTLHLGVILSAVGRGLADLLANGGEMPQRLTRAPRSGDVQYLPHDQRPSLSWPAPGCDTRN